MEVKVHKSSELVSFELYSSRLWQLVGAEIALLAVSVYAYCHKAFWWVALLPLLGLALFRSEAKEHVLIIKGLGVQTGQRGLIRFLQDNNSFYPKHSINTVLINEIFEGYQINYVLQMILKDCDHVSLVFPAFRPRLDVLQDVWRHISLI